MSLASQVGTSDWSDELGTKLTWMAQQGIQSASLQLSPEHLGPLQVNISVHDGQASVWFGAAQPDTRAALQQSLPQLRQLFANQGLTLADAGVSRESPRGQDRQSSAAAGIAGSGDCGRQRELRQPHRRHGRPGSARHLRLSTVNKPSPPSDCDALHTPGSGHQTLIRQALRRVSTPVAWALHLQDPSNRRLAPHQPQETTERWPMYPSSHRRKGPPARSLRSRKAPPSKMMIIIGAAVLVIGGRRRAGPDTRLRPLGEGAHAAADKKPAGPPLYCRARSALRRQLPGRPAGALPAGHGRR